jgi:hypothetical protein
MSNFWANVTTQHDPVHSPVDRPLDRLVRRTARSNRMANRLVRSVVRSDRLLRRLAQLFRMISSRHLNLGYAFGFLTYADDMYTYLFAILSLLC